MCLDPSEAPAGCGDALGALTSLRTLTLGVTPDHRDGSGTGNFGFVGTSLQRLSQLTYLDVDPDRNHMYGDCKHQSFEACLEAAGCVQALPVSLKKLRLSRMFAPVRIRLHERAIGAEAAMSLEHLTSLSVLQLRLMREMTVLPAGLRVLRVRGCHSIEPLVPSKLQHLQELHITGSFADTINMEHMLNVVNTLRGRPQVRGLHLGFYSLVVKCVPLQLARALAQVPLVELSIAPVAEREVGRMGSFTQLTSLSTKSRGGEGSVVKQLVAALQQQTALQKLHVEDMAAAGVCKGQYQSCSYLCISDTVLVGSCTGCATAVSASANIHKWH